MYTSAMKRAKDWQYKNFFANSCCKLCYKSLVLPIGPKFNRFGNGGHLKQNKSFGSDVSK